MLPVGQYETEVLATFLDPAGNLLGIDQQPGPKPKPEPPAGKTCDAALCRW